MATLYHGMYRMTGAEATNEFGQQFGQNNVDWVVDRVYRILPDDGSGALGVRIDGAGVVTWNASNLDTSTTAQARQMVQGNQSGVFNAGGVLSIQNAGVNEIWLGSLSFTPIGFMYAGSRVGRYDGTSWVWGVDPSGSEYMRVGGKVRAQSFVTSSTRSGSATTETVFDSSSGGYVGVSSASSIDLTTGVASGLLFLVVDDRGYAAKVIGGYAALSLTAPADGAYTAVVNNAGTLNFYVDTGRGNRIVLQNLTGGARAVRITAIRY